MPFHCQYLRSAVLCVAALALLLDGGCTIPPRIDPLNIRQEASDQHPARDPNLSVVEGRLVLAADGKSQLPYVTGTDGGCVAGVVGLTLVLIPVSLFLGNGNAIAALGGVKCDHDLPYLAVVRLETGQAAALLVQNDGDFLAQAPPGTYLVAGIVDDGTAVPVRFAFQVPVKGRAYYLGNVAVNHTGTGLSGRVLSMALTSGYPESLDQLTAKLDSGKPVPHETSPLTQVSMVPAEAAQRYFPFPDQAHWDAYIASAVDELRGRGMNLLTPQQIGADPKAVKIAVDLGADLHRGVGRLENGHLSGLVQYGNNTISLSGEIRAGKLWVELHGALNQTSEAFPGNNNCSASGSTDSLSGKVTMTLFAACGSYAPKVTLYMDLPTDDAGKNPV